MNNMSNKDYAADYLALKVANDQLRESGKLWVWDQLNKFCAGGDPGWISGMEFQCREFHHGW